MSSKQKWRPTMNEREKVANRTKWNFWDGLDGLI